MENITGRRIDDLAQIVYIALLTTPAEMLEDLQANGQIRFYIVGIIRNQYFSKKSRYYRENVRFLERSEPIPDEK